MATAPEWADLPDFALLAVLRLHSLLDFFAVGGVCRAWRSFLHSAGAAHLYLSSRPLPRPRPCRSLWWPIRATPPQPPTVASCRVHALGETSSFQSLLSNEPPTTLYLGYSHGRLLPLRRDHRQTLLTDVLSGAEFLLPGLRLNRSAFYYAALSAPPSSPAAVSFSSSPNALSCTARSAVTLIPSGPSTAWNQACAPYLKSSTLKVGFLPQTTRQSFSLSISIRIAEWKCWKWEDSSRCGLTTGGTSVPSWWSATGSAC